MTQTLRVLAWETTGLGGHLAALEAVTLDSTSHTSPIVTRAVRTLDSRLRSAQSLAPAVAEILQTLAWPSSTVDVVAVVVGPGSFTGLRIGVTFAKTFAYAAGSSLIGLTTHEVLATAVPRSGPRLDAIVDAQRGEIYRQAFVASGDAWQPDGPIEIVDANAWLAALERDTMVTGPALVRLAPQILARAQVVDRSLWEPNAVALGERASHEFLLGRSDDLVRLTPLYVRRSAAEEKRTRKTELP